ncbi:MAG: Fe-S cluster assembly protein SufD [Gammaproteobacteria bacterium]|jgi:Fe-S cluster assembly protein SufD|uniref:Fe-S cluster assembly protein SufD n=1 Tax=Marinomonas TaxID=28253 RepID=UPI000C1DE6AC|nr:MULTISPECIES: Fe-S cluster assembly protein SufD [unclassified Marinomonas]MBU1295210.1 Fe-S cluster assembly protein SufD [Gammaproteobacteria bacterium]MBU1464921.1 Fe-S cluster assembly protein SufD [Gammaproteobacteria bacterium]MBU2021366.1 Fe-S cluster assembly protein SufD [Gammaproteobacteria bacterium]MBU2240419.1 Fe-S cluster assembly protein SufD [Gammaproteobacteria bacterium]MBU2321215.1 Fe-S cluster assembly protein SufD [Gammaproteobacteria bacterium]|tara:strand:- start:43531 stop:44790 length:1260 start_codon:yes stop_codon:yes gene_type:complete
MSEWLESAIARAQGINDWLAPKRAHALELLANTKWPTRKTEAWRYTPLRPVERTQAKVISDKVDLSPVAIADLSAIELVFVNGQFDQAQLTKTLPEGLSISLGSDLGLAEQTDALSVFSMIKPERHIFGLVNDALAQDVVVVTVAEGVEITQPIRISSLLSQGAESHTRVQVALAAGSRLVVIEDVQAQGDSLNTAFVEYNVAANARLEHYRFALQTGSNVAIGGSHFNLHDHAKMNSTIVGFGSDLSRLDTDIIHAGEFADAKLNAMYLLDGKELFDLHATVEHAKPNGKTEENVRCIVADRARAVFNGRIHIHRDAQKTLAELNNRNLLLSDKAEINTKPELEIYADDVKCAHGATVAQIDKQALYYLQTRGVSRSKAQVMLNFGFINELIDLMPNAALAEWIRPIIRERFAQMEVK